MAKRVCASWHLPALVVPAKYQVLLTGVKKDLLVAGPAAVSAYSVYMRCTWLLYGVPAQWPSSTAAAGTIHPLTMKKKKKSTSCKKPTQVFSTEAR